MIQKVQKHLCLHLLKLCQYSTLFKLLQRLNDMSALQNGDTKDV